MVCWRVTSSNQLLNKPLRVEMVPVDDIRMIEFIGSFYGGCRITQEYEQTFVCIENGAKYVVTFSFDYIFYENCPYNPAFDETSVTKVELIS